MESTALPRRHKERLAFCGWVSTYLAGILYIAWVCGTDFRVGFAEPESTTTTATIGLGLSEQEQREQQEREERESMMMTMTTETTMKMVSLMPNAEWALLVPAYLCVAVVVVVIMHAGWGFTQTAPLDSSQIYMDGKSRQKYQSEEKGRGSKVPAMEDLPVLYTSWLLYSNRECAFRDER